MSQQTNAARLDLQQQANEQKGTTYSRKVVTADGQLLKLNLRLLSDDEVDRERNPAYNLFKLD